MTKLLPALQLAVCLALSILGAERISTCSVPDNSPGFSTTVLGSGLQGPQGTGGPAHASAETGRASQPNEKKPTDQKSASTRQQNPTPNTLGPDTKKNGSDNPVNPSPGKDDKGANANPTGKGDRPSYHDSIEAFWWTFRVMTRLLIVLVVVLIVSLSIFSFMGKWSLADALSEESSVQPNPNEVKMVASSSRIIALVGLMGILTVVLGIGYSIVWNLYTGEATNLHLDEIRKFLFGAATLFAPYLANQLRAIFDDSPAKPGPAPVPGPARAPVFPPAPAPPLAAPAPAPAVPPVPAPPAPALPLAAPGAAPGTTGARGRTGTP